MKMDLLPFKPRRIFKTDKELLEPLLQNWQILHPFLKDCYNIATIEKLITLELNNKKRKSILDRLWTRFLDCEKQLRKLQAGIEDGESTIEKAFKDYAESKGFIVYKFVSPGQKGVPDRIILAPNGMGTYYVELKRLHGKLSTWQKNEHKKIREQGYDVFVPESKQEAFDVINEILEMEQNCEEVARRLEG